MNNKCNCFFYLGDGSVPSYHDTEGLVQNQPKSKEDKIIKLTEYAKLNNINISTLQKHCRMGKYKTAHKVGRDWLISRYETVK